MTRASTRMLCLFLLALSPALGAEEKKASPEKPPYPEQLVEDFGRVIYCQQAYEAPQNQRRVYGHDLEQCAEARRVIDKKLAIYPIGAQAQLQDHAKQRATVIRANTADVYQVLGACREACEKIATKQAPAKDSDS